MGQVIIILCEFIMESYLEL